MSQPPASTRPVHRVDDQATARLLLDRSISRYLVPFLDREMSVGAAAADLDTTIGVLLPRVRRLARAGLLVVTREEPRKGRAIKYYRSVADEFFVPVGVLDPSDLLLSDRPYHDLMMEGFAHLLDRYAEHIPDLGFSVYRKDRRIQVYLAMSAGVEVPIADETVPAVMWEWRLARLPPARAKHFQLEFLSLLDKMRAEHDPSCEATFINVRMAPLDRRIDLSIME